MADNFLGFTGLQRLWNKIKSYIDTNEARKQDTLVSGTNIKTINNTSLLGSGNVDADDVLLVTYNNRPTADPSTPYAEVNQALIDGKDILFRFWHSPNQRYQPTFFARGPQQQIVMRFLIAKNFTEYAVYPDDTWTETVLRTFADADDLTSKQNTLVSGENIKTINNESILGSGNLDVSKLFIAKVGTTSAAEIIAAYEANKVIVVVPSGIHTTYNFVVSNVNKASSTRCQIAGAYLNGMTFSNGLTIVKYDIDGTAWTFSSQNCQNRLVSGESIKTINNQSILGPGNIDVQGGGGGNVVVMNTTDNTPTEVLNAYQSGKVVYLNGNLVIGAYIDEDNGNVVATVNDPCYDSAGIMHTQYQPDFSTDAWGQSRTHVLATDDQLQGYMQKIRNATPGEVLITDSYGQAQESGTSILDLRALASETFAGLVKTNPSQNIDLNANGQLEVGGRLGQYPDGGVFYPVNIEPTNVGASSFLMTDGAKNIDIKQRTFAIMAGANITCKSTIAGSTTYRVSNTQANRFALAAVKGGRAALNQADAIANGTAAIVSIKYANGGDLNTPTFGATDSNNDIIITLARTINPAAATTQIRVYGTNASTDNIMAGQGVGAGGGKVISLGQSTFAGGNQNIAFGNSVYVNQNNSVGMGHTMLINKQYCFGAGQGHDFTNGANGTAALGTWSEISSNTKLAVGNGTADNLRSNIFEVKNKAGATGIVMKSPNGTKYELTVDDSGNLSTTEA